MRHQGIPPKDADSLSPGLTLHPAGIAGATDVSGDCSAWPSKGASPADRPAEEQLDQLLRIHEYERCRMGQELHDSTGQLIVALQLGVAQLKSADNPPGPASLIDDIQSIVSQIDREIRSLAFLHYPVELGDRDLCSAVQALALGFGRRTGIRTTFKCLGERSPVSQPISIAMLRVAQEALVNIHRHSHASSAHVALGSRRNRLQLTVSDDGVGMKSVGATGEQRGIGLLSMRHRVNSLGGNFELINLKHGTRLSVSVPLAA